MRKNYNNYHLLIQDMGLINQHLISKYLDYGLVKEVMQLKYLDLELQRIYEECKAELPEKYIWRTRGDNKVRSSHAENNGKIFFSANPPSTGNPGDEYGCRCTAEPYMQGESEYANQYIKNLTSDATRKWGNTNFIKHFYTGGGANVTLAQTGNLQGVTDFYFYKLGKYNNINSQIIAEARKHSNGEFFYDFSNSYDFGDYLFAFGSVTIKGYFKGSVRVDKEMLYISGLVNYWFTDTFTDPISLRDLIRGTSEPLEADIRELILTDAFGLFYDINGHWETKFNAVVMKDGRNSMYN